jgi:hypothetical protein
MSQKNYNLYMQKKLLYYFILHFFFVIICLQEIQIWKHRVIGIEKIIQSYKWYIIYIHTITKLGIHVEKKLKERNMMGKTKNELMIQKECVACKKWHLTIQRIIMAKKMAIMKMTIVN